jgi:hypothetical protein
MPQPKSHEGNLEIARVETGSSGCAPHVRARPRCTGRLDQSEVGGGCERPLVDRQPGLSGGQSAQSRRSGLEGSLSTVVE